MANPEGGAPAVPEAWGWRQATVGTGNFEREEQRPQGERIGWLEDENLYLEPNAALASVQKQGRDSGDSLAVTGRTLRKRLRERGLLLSTDEARQVLTVRKTLEGKRREVLHISVDFFSLHTEKPNQPDHGEHGRVINALWSGQRTEPDQPDQQEPPIHAENSGNGRVGRVFDAKKEQNGGEGVRSQSGPAPEEPPEDAAWKWTA